MSHIRCAALCAVTTSLLVPVSVHAKPVSLWNLNGSVIGLYVDGASFAFRYQEPRKGLRDEGVNTGTLLFSGTKSGADISGTGYVFSKRCGGAIPYPVAGAAADERTIRLYGASPIHLDYDCRPLKFKHDVNEFTLLKQIAARVVSTAALTAPGDTPPAADNEGLVEEQRLAEVQVFSEHRDACRRLDIAACDAALSSPQASAEDASALQTWREAAVVLATALQDCQTGSYTACNTALAVPVLSEETRTRVMAWKQQASFFAKLRVFADEKFAALKATIAPISAELRYRPSPRVVNMFAAALTFMLMTFLMALALHNRHILAKARSAANRLATSAHDLSGAAQALLPHVTGAAQKCWNWFIGPLVEQAPAPVATSTLAVMAPPRRVPVKDRDTPGAIAALELAMAYLAEVREADRPALDDEATRKEHLNTLSLAAKQLEKAESLDPDAVYEREADDGTPLRFSVSEVKAEALFLEGMTHSTYDMKRAIPSLMKATALNPDDPCAFFALGIVHAANHNKKQALAAFRRAVALDPKNLTYRKELNRVENMTAAEIAAYKATRGAEHVYDAGIGVANAGVRVYNVGVILWNIFAFTYNVLTWPLRLVLRIAG